VKFLTASSYTYFITTGMASVITEMEDGSTAEVGVVGNEGMIGNIFLLGLQEYTGRVDMKLRRDPG
jgi:CRP-like cAMP-binding protein